MKETSDPKPIHWLRILQYPVIRLLLLGGILFLIMGISNGFRVQFPATPLLSVAVAAVMATLGLTLYVGFVRFVERRPVRELALPGMGRELGFGLLLGAGLYTLCVMILMLIGVYRIDGLNPWVITLPALAVALSSGVLEELLYRGALFRIVEESLGSWISLAVSSFVFGIRHLLNPAGTLMGAISISIEAGLLLAAAYMLTGRLWLCIGLHIAWNFTQSGVFSNVISGAFSAPGLIKSVVEGPVWLTGGDFGLESSMIAVLLCTTTGIVLLILAVRRGNIIRPFWKREGLT